MVFTQPALDALPRHPVVIGEARGDKGGGETPAHICPGAGGATRVAMSGAGQGRVDGARRIVQRLAQQGDADRA